MDQSLAPERAPYAGNPARVLAGSGNVRVLVFILAHIILALAMQVSNVVATAHAALIFLLGLFFLLSDREPYRLIYLVAYIVGAEVLWRGTGALILWEYGKYASAALLGLGLLRYRRLLPANKAILVYFILLLPSILVVGSFDRERLSFNLSGPLLLAVATMFMSTVRLTIHQVKRILLMLVAPAVGLAVLVVVVIARADFIVFTQASNKALSAGFGANQTSSILGLGAWAAFMYALISRQQRFLSFGMIAIVLWLLSQTALTFSRGGLWTAIGAIVLATFFLLRDRRSRGIFILGVTFLSVLIYFLVLPFLDSFTSGTLLLRLQDTSLTGRDLIIQADLIVFRDNWLAGVGPGGSNIFHALTFRDSAAHTEYSRLLAEHGLLGLIALILLLATGARQVMRSGVTPLERAFLVSSLGWALLYMVHAATRLAAPSFMFALAAATISLAAGTEAVSEPHSGDPEHAGSTQAGAQIPTL